MRQEGRFVFAGNFEVQYNALLDARQSVPTKADLLGWPEGSFVPEGLVVYVVEECSLYVCCDGTQPNLPQSWIEILPPQKEDDNASTFKQIYDATEILIPKSYHKCGENIIVEVRDEDNNIIMVDIKNVDGDITITRATQSLITVIIRKIY